MTTRLKTTLTIVSLLAILFGSFHLADDVVRGKDVGGTNMYTGVIILAVWLYATVALSERRSGQIIMLIASIGSAGVPYLHMRGAGLIGGSVAGSRGAFFWVWTLLALGATALVTVVLSARALWSGAAKQPLPPSRV